MTVSKTQLTENKANVRKRRIKAARDKAISKLNALNEKISAVQQCVELSREARQRYIDHVDRSQCLGEDTETITLWRALAESHSDTIITYRIYIILLKRMRSKIRRQLKILEMKQSNITIDKGLETSSNGTDIDDLLKSIIAACSLPN